MTNISKEIVVYVLAFVCTLVASVFDIRKRKIPNALTSISIASALGINLIFFGWLSLGTSLLAGFLAGGLLLLFYLAGGIGAGDVKLLAAVACFLGLHAVVTMLFMTALCGALLGLIVAIRKRILHQVIANAFTLINHHYVNGLRPHPIMNVSNKAVLHVPFALPIMMACVLTACLQVWGLQI